MGPEQGKLNPITFKEVTVPRETGPTIARWQLGRQLKSLREAAAITQMQIAEVLGCSESKIYKIESGDVGIGRGDLLVMLDRYHVTDDADRETVFDLQKQGKQRGWWSRYGQLPNNYATYVGLEGAATSVRNFELAVMPGLLQTEEYAHTIISASRPAESEETKRHLQLRMERQKCLVEDPPLKYWSIIDESVLRRETGGSAVMREQLRHLATLSRRPNITVQVLPFSEGWHPGTLGSFNILEFPEDVHSPVVYTETLAGDAYLEREEEIRRVNLTYTHLHAAALSASKSRELIAAIAKDLA
jgi:transcriptional regulator with XRE-family HTH domain